MNPPRTARASAVPQGPFTRRFDVRALKGEPRSLAIEATSDQCAAVAEAIGLPAIASFAATFRLVPRAGERVDLDGRVRARVTQICVVTLEPFETDVDQPVELRFAPAPEPAVEPRGRGDVRMSAPAAVASGGGNDDQDDPPDEIVGGFIDLGAIAVEFLVLGLDPYPRKPGVHFDDMVVEDKDDAPPSPFAALARLKDKS